MSNPVSQDRAMINQFELMQEREDVVAQLGAGRLVRVSRLQLELQGGTKDDETEATGGVAMFMPDLVLAQRGSIATRRCSPPPQKEDRSVRRDAGQDARDAGGTTECKG